MTRWLKRLIVIVPLLVALYFGAVYLYANVLRDTPEKFDDDSLRNALTTTIASTPGDPATTVISVAAPATSAAGPTASSSADASTAGSAVTGDLSGAWAPTSASEFGYRVEEVVSGINTTAAGRSNEITGSLTIDGTIATAAQFAVDVASITSDEDRRDGQFRGRIMETDTYPTATFNLTSPIDFGTVPSGDDTITASATGDLTLHGVTKSVTFDITALVADGQIGVRGEIPIVFADYEIDNPSNQFAKTEDHGVLEFVLVFAPA